MEYHHWAQGVPLTPMSASPISGHASPTQLGVIRYMISDTMKTTRAERRGGSSKIGSKYRGVTHHARTNRYESHIWDDGKQVYLGGFYNEVQAALAYDLAATRFRGDDAVLNFNKDICTNEHEARNTVTQEQVVMCLREQSKAMNKVDQAKKFTTEAWELQISHTINPAKHHIGVFGTEIEAARAYDRALIKSLGVDSAPLLNFQLVEYIDMLDNGQISEGMHKGLIPSVIPQSFSPSMPPTPIYTVNQRQSDSGLVLEGEDSDEVNPTPSPVNGNTTSHDNASPAGTPQGAVTRRTSNTPRSVLESYQEDQEEVGDKRVERNEENPLDDDQEEEVEQAGEERKVRVSKRLRREPPSIENL